MMSLAHLALRRLFLVIILTFAAATASWATPFTTTVPATGVQLPAEYPEAGGTAIVLTGVNGNIYYQFTDPTGAFRGFQNSGQPTAFQGNPFTINDPNTLDCGFSSCATYFGGAIARMDVRFTAYDGDTQSATATTPAGFDFNDIDLLINGFNVGSWSGRPTEATSLDGLTSFGMNIGFGNGTFDTGWFSSTDPALLGNILATGQTVAQVLDDDPNDNYWDFRRGNTLAGEDLRTVAPGYDLTKTRRDAGDLFGEVGSTTYLNVGDTVIYDYLVRNIGSVRIDNVTVTDDKIGPVTCNPTSLEDRPNTALEPDSAECTGFYTVTQADVDAGTLTNVATATGDPEYGELGALSDDVTLTASSRVASMDFEKTASPTTFTTVGEQITYTMRAINTGEVTISNVVVTDPKFPSQSCNLGSIAPLSTENTDNDAQCQIVYTITQADIDNAAAGTQILNTASVTASDPDGSTLNDSDNATATGPTAMPAMTVSKIATPQTYSAVGDVISYAILVTNTGNVTWTTPVNIDDPLTPNAVCPAVTLAPGGSVTCTASYPVTQADLDAESLTNVVSTDITVNGVPASGTATETIGAVVTPLLSVEKSLSSGPDPFTSTTDQLVYSYVLSNDGNVVLNNIDLTDDKTGLTCPAATLAVGLTMTCTSAPYTVTQDDLNAGSVTNVATATSTTGQGGAVPDATDDFTVNAQQLPSLATAKVAMNVAPGDFSAGATVTYTYTVTNNGNVELAGPFTVNDDKISGPIACGTGPLAPGEFRTCTADYIVQSADVGLGFVTNTATSTDGTTTSPPVTETVPQSGTPAITVVKTAATPTYASVGDPITYNFLVTNSGDTVIDSTSQPITITDAKFTASGDTTNCTATQPASLNPMQSFTCTGIYTGITQADIDAGSFTNEAFGSFMFGTGVVTSDTSEATVPTSIVPSLTLTKSAPVPAEFTALNQEIVFTFDVTNDTAQTIATATVTDTLIPALSCALTNIAPNATQSCTGSYFITQADMDAETLTNTASATGTSSTGANIPASTDSATVILPPSAIDRSFTLDKQTIDPTFAAVGDRIDYVFEVVNTGNQTLTDIMVTDATLGFTCNVPSLAPGLTDRSCFADKIITQADIDAGTFVNNASATATGAVTQLDDETATGPTRTPSFTFTKSATPSFTVAGDTIRYDFVVVNTGNVTLSNIVIDDTSAAIAPQTFNCTIPTLAVGATDNASCFFDYIVRQQDVDAGAIDNTASVSVDTPLGGAPLTDTSSAMSTGPAEVIDLVVDKVQGGVVDGVYADGTTETFLFTVTNNSNVTVTGMVLTDIDPSAPVTDPPLFSCTLPDLLPGASTTQCLGGAPLMSTYTADQNDVDRGSFVDVVTVVGTTAQTTDVTATDQLTLLGPAQMPALTIVKNSPTANFAAVGDVLDYTYRVTNSGNITITAPISVEDDKTSVSCPALPTGGIAPTAFIDCTASYTVTQEDLNAGNVTNVAKGLVSQPVIANATYPSGVAAIESPTDNAVVPALQMPALTIDKRVKAGSASTYSATTDVVTFEFVVTNTGNETTNSPILINDVPLSVTNLVCGPTGLAPGDSVTCEATWSPSQADINAGTFTNTANAQADFDSGTLTSPDDSATVAAIQNPGLTVTKVIDPNTTLTFSAMQFVNYNFTIQNTGNETINGPLTVNDNLIGAIACGAGPLLPGATSTCSAMYQLTVDDVRLGSVTNIASATGTTTGGDPVTSDPTSETIPQDANPAIDVTKAVTGVTNPDMSASATLTFDEVGDVIEYTYTLTNNSLGNPNTMPPQDPPSLAADMFITDDKITGDLLCYTSVPAPGNFEVEVGETVECIEKGYYTVTQADLDAVNGVTTSGFVTNNAFGKTTFGSVDPLVSAPVQVTVQGVAAPAMTVTKSVTNGPTPAVLDSVLEFTIVVTNTGNQTMSGVVVTDPMVPVLACTVAAASVAQPLTLAPTDVASCVGNYTVTQADVDAQALSNTATASGNNPQGTSVTETGSTTHPVVTENPSITIDKDLAAGEPGTAFAAVDQDVTYSIAVENTGNVSLLNVTVTDILFPGETCVIGTMAPGAVDTTTCTFTYTVTQDDVDRGFLNNEAMVTSVTNTPSATVIEDTDNLMGTGPDREPSISINKDTVTTTFAAEGDVIPFTFIVANTGNVRITAQPTVTDPKIAAISCDAIPAAGLGPNEFITCTGNYSLLQTDVDAGFLTNSATATVADPVTPGVTLSDTDTVTITGVRTPALTVAKAANDDSDVVEGQIITYTYTVANTGNVTLTNVTLDDQHTTQAGTSALVIAGNPIASIAPNTSVDLTATYTVTQADLDAGTDITNTVSTTATPPTGVTPPVIDPSSEVVTVASPDPSLAVLKTATPPAVLAAGQSVIFTITVENDGNVSLTNIVLADTLSRNDGSTVSPAPVPVRTSADTGTVGALDVDEVWTYQITHVLTQDDMDAGGLSNSARAFGDDPFGTTVDDVSDNGTGSGSTPTPVIIPPLPAIEGEKTITSTALTLGATVSFEITATNTGNVTLNSVAVSSDTLLRADGTPLVLASGPSFFTADMGSGAWTLQVGETATYRATYVLTQDDIDAGGINNQAVVTGTPPVGGPVTDITDDADPADGNTTTDLVIPALPALDVDKTLTAGGPTFDTLGQVLTYTFTVTNTGNVTLTDAITINDPQIPSVTCQPVPLAPLADLTCTGTYAVTQDDLDAGQFVNTATAQSGTTISDPDSETVLAQQDPALETVKEAVTITVNGTTYTSIESQYFVTGAVVDYEYTVTNTGNVTITDQITVSDNLITGVTCPVLVAGGLPPTGAVVCTGSYTVTATDVSNTSVTNIASATDGTTTSPLVSETVPASGDPLMETTKSVTAVTNADASAQTVLTFDEVGDVLTYTFTIENTGTVAFASDVVIVDDKIAASPLTCFAPSGTDPDFAAGEMLTCSATYTVTQDDLDAGEVINQAFAQTTSAGMPVVSAPVSETTVADNMPAIEITKSAATLPVTTVGQVLTYTLTLENTGNQTLRDVRATDPLLPAMTCAFATMAPDAVETCDGTYTVTQDDVDAGTLVNTADARAITPDGGLITDDTSLTLDMPAAMPALTLAKSATPDPFGAVGSAITYIFEVGNPGNVTLFNVTVTDPALDAAYSCVVPRLNVGTTDATCTYAYTITQDDKDAGEIVNTASATGTDPFGTPTTITDTITTPAQPAVPGIEATKTVSGGNSLGSAITFTMTLRNTGDVTLDVGTITDTMTRIGNNTPAPLDAPFAYVSGDTDNDTLLDVTEVWTLTAVRTLTQADIDQGGLTNIATVAATDPFGTVVDDVADNGIDSDGNTTDDPTTFVIVPGPAIEATKTVLTGGSSAGDTVEFQIAVTNVGDVTLTDIRVSDDLTRADGTPLVTGGAAVLFDPIVAFSGMAPNETWLFSFTHELTQEDVDSGGLINTATATGTPPSGPDVSDVSDNGDDTDGTIAVDGTGLNIAPAPAFDVEKVARPLTGDVFAGDTVTFDVTISNRGNVTLSNLTVADSMTNLAGDPITPTVAFATGVSETQIGAGLANTYIVTYVLTTADIDAGGVENSFTANVTTPAGVPLTDVSDDGDDTDGNALDDPTQVLITPIAGLLATKEATVPVRLSGSIFEVTFDMTIENIGNITETGLIAEDDLAAFVAPATLISTTTATVSRFASGGANAGYNGVSDINLLSPGTSLTALETATMQITVVYDTANGSPAQPNQLSVRGDNAPTAVFGVASVIGSADADIFASKSVTPDVAILGATVSYTLVFENRLDTSEAGLTLVDDLPSGITVNNDTILYNGSATPAPVFTGGNMIWDNVSLAPSEVVTITFDARITGGGGEIVNRAYVLNSDGGVASNIAEATLRRRLEAVFDCGDVIGKVFDDRNGNGYQDGVEPQTGITDQTYYGSKFEAPVVTAPDYEPGLPNARLYTVDGTVITTDQYGRFSVPCAALPADIGSNFTLKLDPRSLPTGYLVTTENPRVIRMTPGTVAKMNFGASISRVVDIDLMAAAFQQGTAQPTAALISGVDLLVSRLSDAPSVLRLNYYVDGEGRALARARIHRVEELVRAKWQQSGVYRLLIEHTIRQVQ